MAKSSKKRSVPEKGKKNDIGMDERFVYDNTSIAARIVINTFGVSIETEYGADGNNDRHITWHFKNRKYEAVEIGEGWRFHIDGKEVHQNQSFVNGVNAVADIIVGEE